MNCRICNQKMTMIDTVNCVNGHARLGQYPFHFPFVNVDLYQCPNCGHVQTKNFMDDSYYDDYECRENGESCYYSSANEIYSERIEKLYSLNHGKSILDIGCGTGHALCSAEKYFEHCVGIDSSAHDCSIAEAKGLSIINESFNADTDIHFKFDAIMCNMLLEHLENPEIILKKANSILNEGGVILIGIPDGEVIINQGLHHQILTEHINYYSFVSIAMLVQKCGFTVVDIQRDSRFLEMNIYARKNKEFDRCSQNIVVQKQEIEKAVCGLKKILIWGAGAKATSYSILLKNVPIWAVVDSDPNKTGRYISNIDVPVEGIRKEKILQSEAVIILASAYNEEIISLLRKFDYEGKIIYFNHDGNTIQISD